MSMYVEQTKVRKFLSRKINQLNDIIADLDTLVNELGHDFYRVCIFGSARIKPGTSDYQQVYKLAKGLAELGADIVTGGGPGLMEAANRGSRDGSSETRSIGLPIELPFEADANSHLDMSYHHRKFSSRLDDFMRLSHAVVITPGGIGTLLELLYTWQLMQVGHIQPRPVLLLGDHQMWDGFLDWMKKEPTRRGLMDLKDLDMVRVVKDVEEVLSILSPSIKKFEPANHKKKKS